MSTQPATPSGRASSAPPTKVTQELLRNRRIAPMTGSEDFNHGPVLASVKQMNEDAMSVQLFDIDGMKHQVPPAEALREALDWIDQPAREARAKEVALGREMMAEYLTTNPPAKPQTPGALALLQRMTAEAPWTEESWKAIEWLGEATRSP